MAKEAYWFSHDANARNDPNILEMRAKYGMDGYGRYWVLVEMLREQTDYKLKLCQCNAFAMQSQCDKNAIENFINDCINEFNLFDSDGEFFWSNSLIRRMKERDNKSEKARLSASKRWMRTQCETNVDALPTQCDGNAIKEKKRKENKEIVPEFLELATYLLECIRNNKPDYKAPSLSNWALTIGLMIQRDGRKPERIREVISWCQKDSFWQSNILSAEKLRKQFDTLELQMGRKKVVPIDPTQSSLNKYRTVNGHG